MVIRHRQPVTKDESILTMTPEALARTVEDFLAGARDAVVLDDGAAVFDLAQAKYSISGEHNKCLLHLWSAERNLVRRVLDVEIKHEVLRLAVQRLGQTRPGKLEICRQRDRRTPTAKRAARLAYQRSLQRTLERRFPAWVASRLTTSADLERSFGPVYARGLLRRGQSGFAVLGVNPQETQASIDAALTFGILWLDACRLAQAGKVVVEGLKLFLPAGTSALTRERMAHLHPDAAKWQLYELEDREQTAQGNRGFRWRQRQDAAGPLDRRSRSRGALRGSDRTGSGADAGSRNGGHFGGRDRLPLPWTGICQGTHGPPSRLAPQHPRDRVWSGRG